MGDGKINIWNEINSKTTGYTEAPDKEIVNLINNSKISTSLDVGAGNGRHTLFLAKNNVKTKAIDISIEGLKRLRMNAIDNGLEIETEVVSAKDYFDTNTYDLVLSTGGVLNFLKKDVAIEVIKRLKTYVSDGGYMYITVFTVHDNIFKRQYEKSEQIEGNSYFSNKMGTWVSGFKDNELKELFKDWQVIKYFEEDILDDGHGDLHYHHTAGILAKYK